MIADLSSDDLYIVKAFLDLYDRWLIYIPRYIKDLFQLTSLAKSLFFCDLNSESTMMSLSILIKWIRCSISSIFLEGGSRCSDGNL